MSIWAVVSTAVVFISFGPLPKMALRISNSCPTAERWNADTQPRDESEVRIPGVAPGGL